MDANAQRILVADDNAALSTVIEFTVKRAGFIVETAANGEQALQKAKATTFDLVISDHQMPQRSGIELFRALRELPQYAETPFVLLTAKKLELNSDSLREELGIARVMAKPFSPNEVANLLHDLLAAVS